MSLTECLHEDLRVNKGNTKGLFIVVIFRLANAAATANSMLLRLLGKLPIALYKLLINWLLCVDLDHSVTAGPGLRIFHGQGLVVNGATLLGSNVTLRQNTTIGNKYEGGSSPVIGSNVDVGANSVILGDVQIGSNIVIGAGRVVVHDVGDNNVVVGNPARPVQKTGQA